MNKVPLAGMVLLLGVDRFMAEARSVTNTIGNAVGTMAIAAWEGVLDRDKLADALAGNGTREDVSGQRLLCAMSGRSHHNVYSAN